MSAVTGTIQVNEATTIAAAFALAGFAIDATHVSSSGTSLAKIESPTSLASPRALRSPQLPPATPTREKFSQRSTADTALAIRHLRRRSELPHPEGSSLRLSYAQARSPICRLSNPMVESLWTSRCSEAVPGPFAPL
jgi:hypothetical protein